MVKKAEGKGRSATSPTKRPQNDEELARKLAFRKDLTPHLPDPRASKSADDAFKAAAEFLQNEAAVYDDEALRERLSDISRAYWSDAFVDELVKQGEIKERIKALSRSIHNVGDKIYSVDYVVEHYQKNDLYQPIISELDGLDLDLLKTRLGVLYSFCEAFTRQRFSKAGSSSDRTLKCCWSLWKLREDTTGRRFKKNYEVAPEREKDAMTGRVRGCRRSFRSDHNRCHR